MFEEKLQHVYSRRSCGMYRARSALLARQLDILRTSAHSAQYCTRGTMCTAQSSPLGSVRMHALFGLSDKLHTSCFASHGVTMWLQRLLAFSEGLLHC